MKLPKHMTIILKKMCELVGADFDKVNFKDPFWFDTYEWTEEEEQVFKDWLREYLKNNIEARRELMKWPAKKKDYLDRIIAEFCLMWSWRYKQENKYDGHGYPQDKE